MPPLVDALDPRARVVRFDVPGVGANPAPPLPIQSLEQFPLVAGAPSVENWFGGDVAASESLCRFGRGA